MGWPQTVPSVGQVMRIRTAMVLLLCAMISHTGCVVLPVPTTGRKMLAGTPVRPEQLDFLTLDVTTREEVLAHLGNPTVIWEEAQVFSYDWVVRSGVLLWAVGGGYSADAGIVDLPKRYSLLIQFDEHSRVRRFERVARPALQSYGGFLAEWVRERDQAAPSRPAE